VNAIGLLLNVKLNRAGVPVKPPKEEKSSP